MIEKLAYQSPIYCLLNNWVLTLDKLIDDWWNLKHFWKHPKRNQNNWQLQNSKKVKKWFQNVNYRMMRLKCPITNNFLKESQISFTNDGKLQRNLLHNCNWKHA